MKTMSMENREQELRAINEWLRRECGMEIADAPQEDLRRAKQCLAEQREAIGLNPGYEWRMMAEKAVDLRLEGARDFEDSDMQDILERITNKEKGNG